MIHKRGDILKTLGVPHGHNLQENRTYRIWRGMCKRCNPKDVTSKRHGKRGIKVCDRWKRSFLNFLHDMGHPPSPIHQIDRKDNDGDYTPDNCRWVTPTDQARNRRSNKYLTVNGKRICLAEISDLYGIHKGTIQERVEKGWPIAKILSKENQQLRMLTLGKTTMSLSEWARKLGIKQVTISARLRKGWSEERTLTTEVRRWHT